MMAAAMVMVAALMAAVASMAVVVSKDAFWLRDQTASASACLGFNSGRIACHVLFFHSFKAQQRTSARHSCSVLAATSSMSSMIVHAMATVSFNATHKINMGMGDLQHLSI